MRTATFILFLVLGCFRISAQSLPPAATATFLVMRDGDVLGQLVLDTAQYRSMTEVEKYYQHELDQRLANDNLTGKPLGNSLTALTAERDARIKRILTEDQYAQWTALIAEREKSDP
ncbi:MAG: hypothetical protein ABI599_09235 [Flavobacteriales bacterium]